MKTSIQRQSNRSKWILGVTFGWALSNFYIFVFGSLYLGGDAINGYTQAGHYFLCAHGNCAEVTESLWKYSYWHALITIGSFLLVFLEVVILIVIGDIIVNIKKHIN